MLKQVKKTGAILALALTILLIVGTAFCADVAEVNAQPEQPIITIQPNSGYVDQPVMVSIDNFPIGEDITITIANITIRDRVRQNPRGEVTINFNIPDLEAGDHRVWAQGGNVSAYTNFTVRFIPLECAAGEVNCHGQCVDLNTNVNNCGACGVTCDLGETCVSGACTSTSPDLEQSETIDSNTVLATISATVDVGDTVWVPVNFVEMESIASLGFNLSYDPEVVTVSEVQCGNLMSDKKFTFAANDTEPGIIRCGFASKSGETSPFGPVLQVEFTGIGDIGDTSPLSFSKVLAKDSEGTALSIAANDGTLTIAECTTGDLNGDGIVDEGDALLALQLYVGTGEGTAVCGDMNGNGGIDPDDARMILQESAELTN